MRILLSQLNKVIKFPSLQFWLKLDFSFYLKRLQTSQTSWNFVSKLCHHLCRWWWLCSSPRLFLVVSTLAHSSPLHHQFSREFLSESKKIKKIYKTRNWKCKINNKKYVHIFKFSHLRRLFIVLVIKKHENSVTQMSSFVDETPTCVVSEMTITKSLCLPKVPSSWKSIK